MAKKEGGGFWKFVKFLLVLVLFAGVGYGGYVYGQIRLQDNLVEVDFPIKQTFDFDLVQNISIPVNAQLSFPFEESFDINEVIPINIIVPIDEIIDVPLDLPTGKTIIKVPIKKDISISSSVRFSKKINFSKDISFNISEEVPFLVEKTFSIPIDTVIRANVPVPEWMRK